MFLGNAAFGGEQTQGRSGSFTPFSDTSYNVWKKALELSYTPQRVTGPGQVASDLARFYVKDLGLNEKTIEMVSSVAQGIAQISDKQTIDTVLNGVEFALNNLPPELLTNTQYDPFNDPFFLSGQAQEWVQKCVRASQQTPIYAVDKSVFGGNEQTAGVFNVQTITPKPTISTQIVKQPLSTIKTGSTVAPPVIQKTPVSVQQYLEPANEGGGLKLAAVVAAIASFLI